MNERQLKLVRRQRRARRTRRRVAGSAECPRLSVFRSNKSIYVQAIDDLSGVTLAEANSRSKDLDRVETGGGIKAATAVGQLIARRLRLKGIDRAVFDRGGYRYHGRVKALADAARAEGLKF